MLLIGNACLILSGVRVPMAVTEALGVLSSSLAEVSLPTSPPRAQSDPLVCVCHCCVWAWRVGTSSFSSTRCACETWPAQGWSQGLSAGRPSCNSSTAGGANVAPSEGASGHQSSVLLGFGFWAFQPFVPAVYTEGMYSKGKRSCRSCLKIIVLFSCIEFLDRGNSINRI